MAISSHTVNAAPLVFCLWVPVLSAAATEESSHLLDLSYQQFDQTPGSGWRLLAGNNRLREAATLIDAYLARHSALDRFQRATLHWHAAQALALAGETAAALRRLPSARHDPELAESPIRWNDYVAATEAFLQNDRSRLLSARERIVSNKPDDPNLAIVDSLITHFGRPYAEAYKRR